MMNINLQYYRNQQHYGYEFERQYDLNTNKTTIVIKWNIDVSEKTNTNNTAETTSETKYYLVSNADNISGLWKNPEIINQLVVYNPDGTDIIVDKIQTETLGNINTELSSVLTRIYYFKFI